MSPAERMILVVPRVTRSFTVACRAGPLYLYPSDFVSKRRFAHGRFVRATYREHLRWRHDARVIFVNTCNTDAEEKCELDIFACPLRFL